LAPAAVSDVDLAVWALLVHAASGIT